MSRLVVASNRLDLPPGNLAPGGVSVSLAAALRQQGGLWFGWSGRVAASAGTVQRLASGGIDYATLDLDTGEYAAYYNGYCNGVLWPLCHGLPGLPGPHEAWRQRYAAVNRRFARGLAAQLRDEDIVWVHDYHLLLLGDALRATGVTQPIGHFLHVPFPALARHPDGAWLLDHLAAYDLLGFQTHDDLAAFHQAARWHWGANAVADDGALLLRDHRVATGVFPLGVDVDGIARTAAVAQASAAPWWTGPPGAKRIIGADRLDPSKGLEPRLEAYATLLAAQPPASTPPDYLQFITPSRSDLPDRAGLRARLEQAAARINAMHARPVGDALHCVHHALPQDALMGVLATADVGLVTPLRDGMNLLAKEFVAAQPATDPGVLVLSRQAGAARELEAALLVDPEDVPGMARALVTALSMPPGERRERHQAMLAALRRHDLAHWRDTFLQQLRAAAAARQHPGLALRPRAPARALP